eukprot:CAMPEP_0202695890 /NCGR_PEP_ID=MMETSP1385-20130828/9335_1 /ASSEMBLY_ACC=CAM_ASM_000861 /TAXON_ID=933848 /ORGANISM="Elphidium margaritaceum" /LENGTH=779 /DNA_ID=CAMNT_0049351969 /DNA_START=40 /DNA_END=2379 /DNA_ORIENTATION=-
MIPSNLDDPALRSPPPNSGYSYALPDTPTSLASSYNKDVVYSSPAHKLTAGTLRACDLNDNGPIEPAQLKDSGVVMDRKLSNTKKAQYASMNSLHDSISIESLTTYDRKSSHHHNRSILNDFRDIKQMMDEKRNTQSLAHSRQASNAANANEHELFQHWLQHRQRWDDMQQTYEQTIGELEKNLQHKTKQCAQIAEELKQQKNNYETEKKAFGEQYRTLEQENQDLQQKYQALQQNMAERNAQIAQKAECIQHLELKLERANKKINELTKQTTTKCNEKEQAQICVDHVPRFNEEYHAKTERIIAELNDENQRLKQLELTSQSMVERLLKRLEQQIHSTEGVQQQLRHTEQEHDAEIMRLEQINTKLQKNLTLLTKTNHSMSRKKQPPKKPETLSSSSSNSSMFTLSTVMTRDASQALIFRDQSQEMAALNDKLQSMQNENETLKKTLTSLQQSLHVERDAKRNKEMAKQLIFIEKLQNEITEKNVRIEQQTALLDKQKSAMQNLDSNIKTQQTQIAMLEKTKSDVSVQCMEEKSKRQKMEKKIEDLQFENKQLKNKLAALKNMASRLQNEVVHVSKQEAQQRNHGDENLPNARELSIEKEQLLLHGLKDLINKYATYQSGNGHGERSTKAQSAPSSAANSVKRTQNNHECLRDISATQNRWLTPKADANGNRMVHKSDFIHHSKKVSKTPQSHWYAEFHANARTKNNKKDNRRQSMTTTRQKKSVSVDCNKVKVIKIVNKSKKKTAAPNATKTRSQRKRAKCSQSARQRQRRSMHSWM